MYEISNELLISGLIFILIFAVSFQILKKTLFKEKAISAVIALIIALIGVVYISYSQLDFLAELYNLTGAIILISIPYIIIFFFIYSSNMGSFFRKMILVLSWIITIALLQNMSQLPKDQLTNIILIITILTIIIFIFDNMIKNKLNTVKNLKRIK
ncbi:MAG: hypothetical protein AABX30_00685 [Nanoarchaeota archaeon]